MSDTAIIIIVISIALISFGLLFLSLFEKGLDYEKVDMDDVEIFYSKEHVMFFYPKMNLKRTYRKYSTVHERWVENDEIEEHCDIRVCHPVNYLGCYNDPYLEIAFQRNDEEERGDGKEREIKDD